MELGHTCSLFDASAFVFDRPSVACLRWHQRGAALSDQVAELGNNSRLRSFPGDAVNEVGLVTVGALDDTT